MPREEVNLKELAEEAAEVLEHAASVKNVTFSINGDAAVVVGVRRLLYEIVFNLCDNAIKYNIEGGRVIVTVSKENDSVQLTVEDTGIGIPPEDQAHVFERFYRVDKSHSRDTGGTGLGLSIVKHAAIYHHAEVLLESKPGKGTKITVSFPNIN